MEVNMEGNRIIITLGELEAKVLTRTFPLMRPLLFNYVYAMSRILFHIAALGREEALKVLERIERGDDMNQVISDLGTTMESLVDKTVEFPSGEEVDRALGWLDTE